MDRTKVSFAEDVGFKRYRGEVRAFPSPPPRERLEVLGVTVVFWEWRETWRVWRQEAGFVGNLMKEKLRR